MSSVSGKIAADDRSDVAVIGAGWSGLTCALRLARAGLRVTVIDAAPRPGGRARSASLQIAGRRVRVDAGQHLLVGAYRAVLAVGASTGARFARGYRRAPLDLRGIDGFALRRAGLPGRLGLAFGLASARGLGWGERLAALRLLVRLRLAGWRTEPGQTVAQLLAGAGQPEALRRTVWEPLCVGALNTAPEDASAATFACILRDTLGADGPASDFILPVGTLESMWTEPVVACLRATGVRLMLGTSVRSILPGPGGWRLSGRAGEPILDAPQIVIATDPWSAARLLGEAAPELAGTLAAIPHEPIATAYLAWDETVDLPRSIMLHEDPQRGGFGQWLFDRGCHDGIRLGAVVVSLASRLPPTSTNDAIVRDIAKQVCRQLRIPDCLGARLIVDRRATIRSLVDRPLVPTGIVRAAGDSPAPLWLCGDYLDPDYPSTLESAVRSGARVGDEICARAGRRGD